MLTMKITNVKGWQGRQWIRAEWHHTDPEAWPTFFFSFPGKKAVEKPFVEMAGGSLDMSRQVYFIIDLLCIYLIFYTPPRELHTLYKESEMKTFKVKSDLTYLTLIHKMSHDTWHFLYLPSVTAFPDVTYLDYNNCAVIGGASEHRAGLIDC